MWSKRAMRAPQCRRTHGLRSGNLVRLQQHHELRGRSSRPAFWYFYLFVIIVNFVVSLITGAGRGGSGFFTIIGWIISLLLLLATLAVGCRRLHDTGKSGWLQLLWLIPCVGWIIMIIFWAQPGTAGDNQYGPPPTA